MADNDQFQRVAEIGDDDDDAITVIIREIDGSPKADLYYPTYEQVGRSVLGPAMGNFRDVPLVIAEAKHLLRTTPFEHITVHIGGAELWSPVWGELLPIKPSSLIAKPLR